MYNSTKPCPTLFIEAFDYPATGLLPSVDNLYTDKCFIYGLSSAPTYVVSSPSIAIVKSYNNRFFPTIEVMPLAEYINTYGYESMTVHATFFNTLGKSMTPFNETFNNVWLVNYTATGADYSEFVILDSSGTPEKAYPIIHA